MISFCSVTITCRLRRRKEKRIFRGHPKPRQRTRPLHSCFVYYLRWRKEKDLWGIPNSGKGHFPLHSCLFIACGGEREKGLFGLPQTPAKDTVLCTPVFHNHDASPHLFSLCFFECAGDFAEGEFVSVVDRCCFIWLQALAVDACGVGAVQVGDCVGAADMLDGSMDA